MTTANPAADSAALFDGARLTLARHLSGKRKSDLAAAIDMSATAVASWEAGTKRPSSRTVAQLALALGVTPDFFAARSEAAELAGPPHFRSLRSTTQIERDQALAYGKLALSVATEFERLVEFPSVCIPRFEVRIDELDGDGPEQAANLVRREWGLGSGPVGHLVRILEHNGALVVFSAPQTARVDAYSFDSPSRPVVVLNPGKRDYYRQRFDLAHELGHLVMHSDAEPGSRIVEEQAQRFAAEFLMPAGEIEPLLPRSMAGSAWKSLGHLKEQWGVSLQALLMRARRMGTLSDPAYRNAMVRLSALGWRRSEPGHAFGVEQPSLLAKAVELLDLAGVDEAELAMRSQTPPRLFRTVTSRRPEIDGTFEEARVSGLHPLSLLGTNVEAAVEGLVDERDLSANERALFSAELEAAISEAARESEFGELLAARGVTTVALDESGLLTRYHPDGTTDSLR